MQNLKRCAWCEDGGIMQAYHDEEWGVPVHDDRKQFEFILLEVMQCGLNWLMMLKKGKPSNNALMRSIMKKLPFMAKIKSKALWKRRI